MIKPYIIFEKTTGRVVCHGTCANPGLIDLDDANGVLIDVSLKAFSYVDQSGQLIEIPEPSNEFYTFNYTTKQWEDPRTLADLKATQWTLIKQSRSQAEYAGFTWDGSTFDSDALSQQRITGAVTLAQMSSAFTIDWILANNTTRTLNQADMLQVGAALGAHVAAQFAKGVLLREQIESATTQAAVESIVW